MSFLTMSFRVYFTQAGPIVPEKSQVTREVSSIVGLVESMATSVSKL